MPNSQLPTPKNTGTIWELGVVELGRDRVFLQALQVGPYRSMTAFLCFVCANGAAIPTASATMTFTVLSGHAHDFPSHGRRLHDPM
jgi:hypothetical protein